MKRYVTAAFAAIIATVLLTSTAVVWAQDEEVTLDSLAEQVIGLVDDLTALVERVTAIEERLEPVTTGDGICILLNDDFDINPETATKFLESFDALPDDPRLIGAEYNVETGRVGFLYRESSDYSNLKFVTEYWEGCEYVGSSDWTSEEE